MAAKMQINVSWLLNFRVCMLLKGAVRMTFKELACENIRFSSLFATADVSVRNVPSGEERGETDVFAGY